MHDLVVHVKEVFLFAKYLSLENSAVFIYVFEWFFLIQCVIFAFSIDHLHCL